VVDWDMRDAEQAKLRNIARTTLRKYGFPLTSREVVVEKILDVAARELTDKDT
jgi:hypothetical protein